VPVLVLFIVLGMAVYEFVLRRFIDRQIARQITVPSWLGYLNAFIEISVLTLVIVVAREVFSHPLYALSIPAVAAYFLFIILSTLSLDFKLSLFTGGIAAVQYLAVALYTLATAPANPAMDPLFAASLIYMAKALLLFLAGSGAAFVAFELYRRMMNSFAAIEDRNKEKQASEFKSKFLANMSHEIRTPLNAILGHAQLMKADPALSAPQRHALQTIAASGNHLLSVINDVLDLSKIEAGREEIHATDFDLDSLARELSGIFEFQCAHKGLTWRLDADPGVGRVRGDATKLRQVLANLLGNAVKFTDAGSVSLFIRAYPPSDYYFEVRDTGPGIPKAEQASVFDPFRQERQGHEKGGTGLGLAIAARHVEMMGGRLQLAGAAPHGSRFFLTLPLPAAASAGAEAAADPAAAFERVAALAPGRTITALIADDLATNRDVLAAMLRRIGVAVYEAANGTEALALFRAHTPDIVFLDMRMPGLSGPETLRMMQAEQPDGLKYVAVSASALAHERANSLDLGFDAFIDKPVRMARLYACLADLLGVRYTMTPAADSEAADEQTFENVVLSKLLYDALEGDLLAHNMTSLKKHLDDLAALGGNERRLAERLRELGRRYDIDSMRAVLVGVSHG
jgi:signal transduction histidine kinase/CheY-like chemotaxis protein